MKNKTVSEYLAKIGRKGGRSKSEVKHIAVMENLQKAWQKQRENKAKVKLSSSVKSP